MYLHTVGLDIFPVLLKPMDTHPESGNPLKLGRLRMCYIVTSNKYRKIDVLMSMNRGYACNTIYRSQG